MAIDPLVTSVTLKKVECKDEQKFKIIGPLSRVLSCLLITTACCAKIQFKLNLMTLFANQEKKDVYKLPRQNNLTWCNFEKNIITHHYHNLKFWTRINHYKTEWYYLVCYAHDRLWHFHISIPHFLRKSLLRSIWKLLIF